MRKMRDILFLLAVICFRCTLNAQTLNLPLNVRAEDGQFTKLILVAQIFDFRNDSVAEPLDISSARPNDPVVWHQVVKPRFMGNQTVGYAWIFDGSSKLDFASSYTLIAIENVKRTENSSRIWVDRNHNFDFTDDSLTQTLNKYAGTEIALGTNPQGYHVLLERFPQGTVSPFNDMNDAAVRKVQGNRYFYGTSYSLREKRLNMLASNWSNGADSFCIGIKDVNCNGKYDDAGIDVAMITAYRGIFDNLQAVPLDNKGVAYLEWNNAAYTIKKIDPAGNFLQVLRDTASRLKNSLNVGDKIPRFKYCTATKPAKHKSIRRLRGDYVYIYIWRDGEDVFLRDSADWHQLGRGKREDFVVLGLNYGASARYVYQYNNYYETAIKQGYSSNDINQRLRVKQVPTGILLDKKQRIVAVGITPAQAQAMMEKR